MSYMYKPPALKKTEPTSSLAAKKPAGTTSAATKPSTPASTPLKPVDKSTTATKSSSAEKPAANGAAGKTETKPTTAGTTTKKTFGAPTKTEPAATEAKPTAKPATAVAPIQPEKAAVEKQQPAAAAAPAKKDAAVAKKSPADSQPRFRYDYHKMFDAREYRNTYLDFTQATTADEQLNAEHSMYGFIIRTQYAFLKEINKTLTKVEKKKKDEIIMLDIGTGPSIVPACFGTLFDIGTVICTDFTPACRTLLQLWWWGREESFDWMPLTKYISTLAASDKKPVEDPLMFEEKARVKLQAIFSCDVEQSNVLSPNQLEQCDILTSTFVFERAASETEEYEAIIERCNNSIRLNGYIVFAGALNQTWYKTSATSEHKFKVQPITEDDIRRGLKYAGFDNVDIRTLPLTKQQHGAMLDKLFDGDAIYVAKAQKVKALEYDGDYGDA